jgi:hypothetical protein
MPTIAVNLGAVVSSFSDLPIGSYLGEIAKIKLLPPRQAGKFAQLIGSHRAAPVAVPLSVAERDGLREGLLREVRPRRDPGARHR